MEKTKIYQAILFRQRTSSPLQVAFVAPSCEVDEWARVPTKKTGNVRNFQRSEIPKHIQEVSKFFSNLSNASPTAVVVGFDPLRSGKRVETLNSAGKTLLADDVPAGEAVEGSIRITWDRDSDPHSVEELLAAISSLVQPVRSIISAELADIANLTSDVLDELLEMVTDALKIGAIKDLDGEDDTESTDESEDYQSELEMPEEVKTKLAGLSPSDQQVVIGRLMFLSEISTASSVDRTQEELRHLYSVAFDELKPGLLIDGQHRIAGTKKLGKIPFLVTALPNAGWPELAFQFIVTNRTARRVPESLLISIVGNSLSKAQRGDIEGRLREANIRVGLIEAVMQVHEDDQSPFFGWLSFGLKDEPGFLDAAAMRSKVIKVWYERKSPVSVLFDHMCQGKRKVERTEYWKEEELWFDLFCAFWGAVKDRYVNNQVFIADLADKSKNIPVSKLMTATVLMIFQDTVLKHLLTFLTNKENTEGVLISASLPTADKFRELVGNTLQKLNADFFQEWQLSGFDGSKGARDDLADAIGKVISGEQTIPNLKNPRRPHRLFMKS